MDKTQQIYAALESLWAPAPLPAPWCDRTAPSAYRGPLHDYRAVAHKLSQQFSVSDLVAAGVFLESPQARKSASASSTSATEDLRTKGEAPSLSMNVYLRFEGCFFLRRDDGEPPYDVVTSGGCLSGRLPVLAALEDSSVCELLNENESTLLATFSLQDAAVLQSLGYPAVPASGLENLRGQALETFCRSFDVRFTRSDIEENFDAEEEERLESESASPTSPASLSPSGICPPTPPPTPSPTSGNSNEFSSPLQASDAHFAGSASAASPKSVKEPLTDLSLEFVTWHPSRICALHPEKLAKIRSHLATLSANLDLLMDQLYVWEPAPEFLSKLEYALRFGSSRHITLLIKASNSQSHVRLFRRDATPAHSPTTISEAFVTLRERTFNKQSQWSDFQQVVQDQYIGPLLSAVDSEPDPAAKVRALVQALGLSRQVSLLPRLMHPSRAELMDGPVTPEEIERQKLLNDSIESIAKLTQPRKAKKL